MWISNNTFDYTLWHALQDNNISQNATKHFPKTSIFFFKYILKWWKLFVKIQLACAIWVSIGMLHCTLQLQPLLSLQCSGKSLASLPYSCICDAKESTGSLWIQNDGAVTWIVYQLSPNKNVCFSFIYHEWCTDWTNM